MTKSKSEKNIQNMLKKNMASEKLDIIPTHPNNYTDSELFWKNLPQYRPTTPIGMLHYILLMGPNNAYINPQPLSSLWGI
mgnify:CR=1 FL=1